MRCVSCSMGCLLLVAVAGLAAAEDSERSWQLEVDPMWVWVDGNNKLIGTEAVATEGRTTSSTYAADLDSDGTARVQFLGRADKRWGWAIGGLHYDGADGNVNLKRLTAPEGSTSTLATVALGPPVAIPSGPEEAIAFAGETHFQVWSLDLETVLRLSDEIEKGWAANFGLRMAATRDERTEFWTLEEGRQGVQSRNHSGLAKSDVLIGPTAGLRGHRRWGRHGLTGFVRLSVVMGDYDYTTSSGNFGPAGLNQVEQRSSGSETLTSGDLKLAWVYDINDRFGVGLGVYAQAWWGLPTAPIGGEFHDPPLRFDEDVTLRGLMLSFTFGGPSR